jgi:hypothetical protein
MVAFFVFTFLCNFFFLSFFFEFLSMFLFLFFVPEQHETMGSVGASRALYERHRPLGAYENRLPLHMLTAITWVGMVLILFVGYATLLYFYVTQQHTFHVKLEGAKGRLIHPRPAAYSLEALCAL